MSSPSLIFQQIDYDYFQKAALPIKEAAIEGEKRLTQYTRIEVLAVALHVAGAAMLGNGLYTLSGVRIIRSAYFHMGAAVCQGLGHMRLRQSKESVEKGIKGLKKAFKERIKESPSDGKDEGIPGIAAQVFEEFGQWGAISLKWAASKGQEASLAPTTARCKEVGAQKKRAKQIATGSVAFGALAVLLLGGAIYWGKGLKVALPLGVLGMTAPLSIGAYCVGVRNWKRVEKVQQKEALRRVVKVVNGLKVDWPAVGGVLRKVSLTDQSDDQAVLIVKQCPHLRAFSLTGERLNGQIVTELSPDTKSIKFKGTLALSIPFDRLPKKLEKLAVTRFPIGEAEKLYRLRTLRVSAVSADEIRAIGKLPNLTTLRIEQGTLSVLTLPPKLEKLRVHSLALFAETNPLRALRYLKKIKLHQFQAGTANALKGLAVLEVLKVERGVWLGEADLDWMPDHSQIQEVRVKELHRSTLSLAKLKILHKHFLIFISGTKEDLNLDDLYRVREEVEGRKTTFKVRH